MKKQKGFTIIELVVVIAIIAILAAIVITNVTQNINKGKDSSAKADMNKLLSDVTNFYITNGTFDGVKEDDSYKKTIDALKKPGMAYTFAETCAGTGTCNEDIEAIAWCASIELKTGSTATTKIKYCVDSGGNKLEGSNVSCTLGVCSEPAS